MKNIFSLFIIGFGVVSYNYWSVLSNYYIYILKVIICLIILLVGLIVIIYLNDRINYYDLKKRDKL